MLTLFKHLLHSLFVISDEDQQKALLHIPLLCPRRVFPRFSAEPFSQVVYLDDGVIAGLHGQVAPKPRFLLGGLAILTSSMAQKCHD